MSEPQSIGSPQTGIEETGKSSGHDDEGYDDLELLEKQIEEENKGLNTRSLLMIILFIVVAAILLFIILGFFGYLSQGEYGGP